MWPKEYKDYPEDTTLVKEKVEPGKGIVGCEMHDLNGWGMTFHLAPKVKEPGFFRTLWHRLFHWLGLSAKEEHDAAG